MCEILLEELFIYLAVSSVSSASFGTPLSKEGKPAQALFFGV